MKELIPLLFTRKTITNRILNPPNFFRRKCDIGDKMYFRRGYRSRKMEKIGVGIVIETTEWNTEDIPLNIPLAKITESPKKNMTWFEFAWIDGFNNYEDFVNSYKNKKVKNFKMFIFEEFKD